MTFNKKAIMMKFLVTVILAIIIFAPACVFLSKFFRLSEQAENSFNEFTTFLTGFVQGKKEKDSFLLKIDAGTAVVYFEPQQEQVHLYVQGLGTLGFKSSQGGHADAYFKRPDTCTDTSKGCLCLFQEVEGELKYLPDVDRERCTTAGQCGLARIQAEATFSATTARCVQDFSLPLMMPSCTVGQGHESLGYHCKSGFVIERELLKEKGFPAYFTAPRRIALNLEKKDNTIFISPQK